MLASMSAPPDPPGRRYLIKRSDPLRHFSKDPLAVRVFVFCIWMVPATLTACSGLAVALMVALTIALVVISVRGLFG